MSIALLCCELPALAHDSQDEHDRALKPASFGDADFVMPETAQKAFRAPKSVGNPKEPGFLQKA